jgi:hypothetical protein
MPTLWTKPKFKLVDHEKSPTAQVWFAGAHSDVGGGYVNWAAYKTGLSLIPLAWMIQTLNRYVAKTPPSARAPSGIPVDPKPEKPIPFFTKDLLDGGGIKVEVRRFLTAEQHLPWAALYAIPGTANRRVLNQLTPGTQTVAASGRVAFADPFCELVHVSALQRLNQRVAVDKGRVLNGLGKFLRPKPYAPRNLTNIVPYLAASYVRNQKVAPHSPWRAIVAPINSWKEPYIVDWDGTPLSPNDDAQAQRAFDILPSPAAIGVSEMPEEMKYILAG